MKRSLADSVLRSIDVAPAGMAVWQKPVGSTDPGDLSLLYINQAGAQSSGRAPTELIGLPMRKAFPDVLSSDLAAALMHTLQDGTEREITLLVPSDGSPFRAFRNVVHRVDESTVVTTFVESTREQRLERDFRVERRTGLATRAHFDEVFAELIAEHDRGGEPFGVLFVDLDKFKRINDNFSHVCGDELITCIAHRLSGMDPIPHLIARWGGDEFVVLTRWDASENRAFADGILDTFAEPFNWQGQEITICSSIGAITVQGVGFEGRQVLLEVDHAMYEAKREGGNQVVSRILG